MAHSQRRVVAAWPKPDHEGTGLLRKFRFGLAGGHAPDDDFLGAATPLLDEPAAVEDPGDQRVAEAGGVVSLEVGHGDSRWQESQAGDFQPVIADGTAGLTAEYGRGFDRRNLFHMIRFAAVFPDEAIVNALRTQLSWTHFREDYYLDLLFYHRRLRRLVAIELKIERFQAADKGQMELYLRWLEKYEMRPGEEPPLGLPITSTAGKSEEHVELLHSRGGWGRRPEGDAPRSEASAPGARWLSPARPQPPSSSHLQDAEMEPCRIRR